MTAATDPGRPPDQRFADALCGPDGTGDPSVLMPVLDMYPDALSAPMPEAPVPFPPAIDPAAIARAALAAVGRPVAPFPPAVPQPGRYGRTVPDGGPRPPQPTSVRASPAARGTPAAHAMSPSHVQAPRRSDPPHGAAPASSGGSGRAMSPAELAGFVKGALSGSLPARGLSSSRLPLVVPHSPTATAPTPPLPRRQIRSTRRNKGSSAWAVLVFLIVIAFASGIAQRLIDLVSELFNR